MLHLGQLHEIMQSETTKFCLLQKKSVYYNSLWISQAIFKINEFYCCTESFEYKTDRNQGLLHLSKICQTETVFDIFLTV